MDLPIQAQAKKSWSTAAEQVICTKQENKGLYQNPIDPALVSNLTTRLSDALAPRGGSRSRSRSLSLRSTERVGSTAGSVSPVSPPSPSDFGEAYISSPADEAETLEDNLPPISKPGRTASLPPLVIANSSNFSVTNAEVLGSRATEACSNAASKYGSSLRDARPAYVEPECYEHFHCVVSPRAQQKTENNAMTHSRGQKSPFSRRKSRPSGSARALKGEVHSSRSPEESGLSARSDSSTNINTPAQRGREHYPAPLFSQAFDAVQGLRHDRRSPAYPLLQSGAEESVNHNVVPLPNRAETGRIPRQAISTGVSSTLIDNAERVSRSLGVLL